MELDNDVSNSENSQSDTTVVKELQSTVVVLSCEKDMLIKDIDNLKAKINEPENQPFGYRSIKNKYVMNKYVINM